MRRSVIDSFKCVAGLAGLASTAMSSQAQEAPAPTALPPPVAAEVRAYKITGTAVDLRTFGVAIARPGIEAFGNSCDAAGNRKPPISVSDEMLSHFLSRGFSLTSLCLALGSRLRFDPESGAGLPRFVVADVPDAQITLNFPDCFKNGTPLTDCSVRFAAWTRYEYEQEERDGLAEFAQTTLAQLREYALVSGKAGVLWTYEDAESELFFLAGPTYEWVVASSELSQGIGYAMANREGDDPVPEDVLSTKPAKSALSRFFSWISRE